MAPAPPGENSCALAETIDDLQTLEARHRRAARSATCQPVMPGMDRSIMARSGLMLLGEREPARAVVSGVELEVQRPQQLAHDVDVRGSSSISSSLRRGPA